MILISSCLVGVNCRYDGGSLVVDALKRLLDEGKAVSLCPEVLGGLPVPRTPCEITWIKGEECILDKDGLDRTKAFVLGANKTLEVCRLLDIDTAVLKFRSPSCGKGKIYDGNHTGHVIDGDGFTARLLEENGIRVISELDLDSIEELFQ